MTDWQSAKDEIMEMPAARLFELTQILTGRELWIIAARQSGISRVSIAQVANLSEVQVRSIEAGAYLKMKEVIDAENP